MCYYISIDNPASHLLFIYAGDLLCYVLHVPCVCTQVKRADTPYKTRVKGGGERCGGSLSPQVKGVDISNMKKITKCEEGGGGYGSDSSSSSNKKPEKKLLKNGSAKEDLSFLDSSFRGGNTVLFYNNRKLVKI